MPDLNLGKIIKKTPWVFASDVSLQPGKGQVVLLPNPPAEHDFMIQEISTFFDRPSEVEISYGAITVSAVFLERSFPLLMFLRARTQMGFLFYRRRTFSGWFRKNHGQVILSGVLYERRRDDEPTGGH